MSITKTFSKNIQTLILISIRKIKCFRIDRNKMIKRLIEYLAIERRTKYIQYKSSSKSNSARNYINYSTLKTTRLKFRHFYLLLCFSSDIQYSTIFKHTSCSYS